MTNKGPAARLDAETILRYETEHVLYPWMASK